MRLNTKVARTQKILGESAKALPRITAQQANHQFCDYRQIFGRKRVLDAPGMYHLNGTRSGQPTYLDDSVVRWEVGAQTKKHGNVAQHSRCVVESKGGRPTLKRSHPCSSEGGRTSCLDLFAVVNGVLT